MCTLVDRATSHRPERQTALVAMEMNRYNVIIGMLSEIRLPGYDSIEDQGYVFFWSGKQIDERREAGIEFVLRKEIAAMPNEESTPINDRIMMMRLPLQKNIFATLTNPDEIKEQFYSDLRETIMRVSHDDRLVLIGDFNVRVGADTEKQEGVLGNHSVGKRNANGELLLALCSEYNPVITNTLFKYKESH